MVRFLPAMLWVHHALAAAAPHSRRQVKTDAGLVSGVVTDLYASFLGIPYAVPPVGQLRFEPPRPISPWAGTRDAEVYGAACPQQCELPPGACEEYISEDCLSLNVYTRGGGDPPVNAPILVFFHGGRFEQGAAGVDVYNARYLVNSTGVMVVTVNYRLAVLGFLALPDGGPRGNMAMLDQRLALQWVQKNAAAFGGDPDAVTVFGQSAGANSIAFHLTSEGSFGLFSRAVLESASLSLPLPSLKDAGKRYDVFVQHTTCSGKGRALVECLRGLPWQQVVAAQQAAAHKIFLSEPLSMFLPWAPVVDGAELRANPLALLAAGNFSKVPVIGGHVTDEALLFVYLAFPKPMSRTAADALLRVIFTGNGTYREVLAQYPLPKGMNDYRPYLTDLASDYVLKCPTRWALGAFARHHAPAFRYEFDHAWEERGAWGPNYTFCEGRVCHGAELPYVFNTSGLVNPAYALHRDEAPLSLSMMKLWGAFATDGVPSGASLPRWDPFVVGSRDMLKFSLPFSRMAPDPRASFCDLWDRLGYNF